MITTGLGIIFALFTTIWILSLLRRDASVVDAWWGIGFVVLSWAYAFISGAPTQRSWLVVALVIVWGLRLSLHIARRNRGHGEDPRYREMREKHGESFWWKSLFIVFWLQAIILWIVSLPLAKAIGAPTPTTLTALDILGLLTFLIGLTFEAVGDFQLARFKADPSNRSKVMDQGLWRYTRHPNYFGDATLWWGFFLFALATPGGWWTIISPLLMTTLLMKVSGVALLEQKLRETKPAYRYYERRTSAFFPWKPKPGTP